MPFEWQCCKSCRDQPAAIYECLAIQCDTRQSAAGTTANTVCASRESLRQFSIDWRVTLNVYLMST